jgi:hypothetical protein
LPFISDKSYLLVGSYLSNTNIWEKKGGEMPPIFKALATITVWVLFVYGCLAILGGLIICGMKTTSPVGWFHQFVGVASLILSLVAMKLRKSLE